MYACLAVGSRVKFIFLVPTIFCIRALNDAFPATRSHLIPLSNRQQTYLFGSGLVVVVVVYIDVIGTIGKV